MSVVIAIVIAVLIVVALALAWLGRWLWLRQVRRSLVWLIGRREAVHAAERALRSVLTRLADADVAALTSFATEPDHEDRRSLGDVHDRMLIVADELRGARLPKSLWVTAELLEKAARTIAHEGRRVGGEDGAEVLDGLSSIDLRSVENAVEAADIEVQKMCEVYRVLDPAVYGGGLYI